MKNYKGFASMSADDYLAKMKQLKVSYFIQCMDLTNAYNGDEISDEFRNQQREMISSFVDQFPEGSFTQYCELLGMVMVDIGKLSKQEFDDILNGKEIDY